MELSEQPLAVKNVVQTSIKDKLVLRFSGACFEPLFSTP
jgi:hypothetical protein